MPIFDKNLTDKLSQGNPELNNVDLSSPTGLTQAASIIDPSTGSPFPQKGKTLDQLSKIRVASSQGWDQPFTAFSKKELEENQKYPIYRRGVDLENIYGLQQSSWSQWRNSLVKFGANAGGAFVQTFTDIPNVIDAIRKKDYSQLSGDPDGIEGNIDNWLKNLENTFPNYYTRNERNNPWKAAIPFFPGSANFWGDKFLKNLGFTFGTMAGAMVQTAIITYLTGGTGTAPTAAAEVARFSLYLNKIASVFKPAQILTKLGTVARVGNKTSKALSSLETLYKLVKIKNSTQFATTLLGASITEAGVEAREGYKTIKEDLIQDYINTWGTKPLKEDMDEIEKIAKDAMNIRFTINAALLMVSNFMLFGNLVRNIKSTVLPVTNRFAALGKGAFSELGAFKLVDKSIDVFEKEAAKTGIEKAWDITKGFLPTMFSEGAYEEGSQFATEKGVYDYFTRKYKNLNNPRNRESWDNVKESIESFKYGLQQQFTTEEGLQNMFIGALTGMFVTGGQKIIDKKRGTDTNSRTDKAINSLNIHKLSNIFNKQYKDTVEISAINSDLNNSVESGDVFKYKNLNHDLLFKMLYSRARIGAQDVTLEQISMLKELEKENFEKFFGIEFDEKNKYTVDSYINNLLNTSKSIMEIYSKINNIYKNPFVYKENPESIEDLLDNDNFKSFESWKEEIVYLNATMNHLETVKEDAYKNISEINPALSGESISKLTNRESLIELSKEIEEEANILESSIDFNTTARKRSKIRSQIKKLRTLSNQALIKANNSKISEDKRKEYFRNLASYEANGRDIDNDNLITNEDIIQLYEEGVNINRADNARKKMRIGLELLTSEVGFKKYLASEIDLKNQVVSEEPGQVNFTNNENEVESIEIGREYEKLDFKPKTFTKLKDGTYQVPKPDGTFIVTKTKPQAIKELEDTNDTLKNMQKITVVGIMPNNTVKIEDSEGNIYDIHPSRLEGYSKIISIEEFINGNKKDIDKAGEDGSTGSATILTSFIEDKFQEEGGPKKDASILYKSSTTESETRKDEITSPHIIRSRQFLNNAKFFKNRNNYRAIIINPNHISSLGLDGILEQSYKGTVPDNAKNIDAAGKDSRWLASVIIYEEKDKAGNVKRWFVDQFGNKTNEVGEGNADLNTIIYQTLSEPTLYYNGISTKGPRYREGQEEEAKQSLDEYINWRISYFNEKNTNPLVIPFEISRGLSIIENKSARNSIIHLVPKDAIESHKGLIEIPSSGVVKFLDRNLSVPLGVPILKYKDLLEFLQNRKFNSEEAETIYELLKVITDRIYKDLKSYKKPSLISEEWNFLQQIVYTKTKGLKVDANQLGISIPGQVIMFPNKKHFKFNKLEENKEEIIKEIENIYQNVNNTTLTSNFYAPFNEYYLNEKKELSIRTWKNYQTYLLSPKTADGKHARKSIPLTTNIAIPSKGIPYTHIAKYFIFGNIDMPSTHKPKVSKKPTVNPLEVIIKGIKFNLNGEAENKFSVSQNDKNNITFTAKLDKDNKIKSTIIFDEETLETFEKIKGHLGLEKIYSTFEKLLKTKLTEKQKEDTNILLAIIYENDIDLYLSGANPVKIEEKPEIKNDKPIILDNKSINTITEIIKGKSQSFNFIGSIIDDNPYIIFLDDKETEASIQSIISEKDLMKILTDKIVNSASPILDSSATNVDIVETWLKSRIISKYSEQQSNPSSVSPNIKPEETKEEEEKEEEEKEEEPKKQKYKRPNRGDFRLISPYETQKMTPEDLEAFKQWHKENIGTAIPYEELENIIKVNPTQEAWGVFEDGVAKFYTASERGTEYHEIFEGIWAGFLSPEEKKIILDEFRSDSNTFIDRATGVEYYKGDPEVTDNMIKERIADDFADFRLNKLKAKNIKKNLLERLFERIKRFFNRWIRGKKSAKNLFEVIDAGRYKNKKPSYTTSNAQYALKRRSEIGNLSEKEINEYVEDMVAIAVHQIFKSENASDVKKLFQYDPVSKQQLFNNIKIYYDYKGRDNLDDIDWQKVVERTVEKLRTFGANFNEDGEITINEDSSNNKEYIKDPFVVDGKSTSPLALKFFLSTLPKTTGKFSSDWNTPPPPFTSPKIEGFKLLPYTKVYGILIDKLSNTNSVELFIEKLGNLAKENPDFYRFFTRLGGNFVKKGDDLIPYMNTDNFTKYNWILFTQLYQTFSKQFPDAFLHVKSKEENYSINVNRLKSAKDLVNSWITNLKLLAEKEDSLVYFDIVNNIYKVKPYKPEIVTRDFGKITIEDYKGSKHYFNKHKLVKVNDNIIIIENYKGEQLEFKNSKLIKNTSGSLYLKDMHGNVHHFSNKKEAIKFLKTSKFSAVTTTNKAIAYLNAIGVNFTIQDYKKLSSEDQNLFNEATINLHKFLGKNNDLFSLSRNTLSVKSRFDTLATLYLKANNISKESTHFGVDGQRRGNYALDNAPSILENDFSETEGLEELKNIRPELNDVYCTRSQIFKKGGTFLNDKLKWIKRLKISYIQGTKDEINKDNKKTTELPFSDRLVQEINQNLKGYYYIIMPADGSTEWMVNTGNIVNYISLNSTSKKKIIGKIFEDYLRDEIDLALDYKNREYLKNLKNRSKKLRMFADLLPEKMVKEIESMLDREASLDEFDVYIKDNRQEIYDAIFNDFINKRGQDLKSILLDSKKIKIKNADKGTYEYNDLDSFFAEEYDINKNEMTSMELDNLMNFIIVNTAISNIEMHKILFGDPFLFQQKGDVSEAIKRLKSFFSPAKKMFNFKNYDNWLNENNNLVDGNIKLTENDYGFHNYKDHARTTVLTSHKVAGSLRDTLKVYGNTDVTDGFSWIMDTTYREVLQKNGQWYDEAEDFFQWQMAFTRQNVPGYQYTNKELEKHDKELLKNPAPKYYLKVLKPIVRGNKGNKKHIDLAIDKLAQMPIFYSMVKGTTLEQTYIKMFNEKIDYALVDSARKIGVEITHNIYNQDGSFNNEKYNNISNIPWKVYSMQVETAHDENKQQSRGSQITKIVSLNLFDNGVPIGDTPERQQKIQDLYDNQMMLLDNMHKHAFESLLRRLGIKDNGDYFTMENGKRISDALVYEMLRRDVNENTKDTIKLDENDQFLIPFEASPSYVEIKDIIYSMINKSLLGIQMSGGPHVQTPVAMLEKKDSIGLALKTEDGGWIEISKKAFDKLSDEEKQKVVFTDKTLKFYEDEDGKRYCEIMLPHWFKNKFKHLFKTDEELLDYLNKNIPEVLLGIGFRIPTQENSSIEAFKVKGFLPQYMGSTVVVPAEITTKTGSDFDIDKLNMYLKSLFLDENNKIKLVKLKYTDLYEIDEQGTKDYFSFVFDTHLKNQKKKIKKVIRTLRIKSEAKKRNTESIITKDEESINQIISEIWDDIDLKNLKLHDKLEKLNDDALQEFLKEQYVDNMYKKALENAYYTSLIEMVTLPENFKFLISPINDGGFKLTAKITNFLKGKTKIKNTLIDKIFLTQKRNAFALAKSWIGIAAVNITGLSNRQKSKVIFNPDRLELLSDYHLQWIGDGILQLPHNTTTINGKEYLTVSGSKTAEEQFTPDMVNSLLVKINKIYRSFPEDLKLKRKESYEDLINTIKEVAEDSASLNYISKRFSGFATATVDVATDDYILDIYPSSLLISSAMFLESIGAGEKGRIFLQQPIIQRYVQKLDFDGDKRLHNKKNIDSIIEEFPVSGSFDSFETRIDITKLEENIALYSSGLDIFSDSMLKHNEEQVRILKEFLKIAILAKELFRFNQAMNFDTYKLRNGEQYLRKEILLEKARNLNLFTSIDDVLDNTFIGFQKTMMDKAIEMLGEIFKLDKPKFKLITNEVLKKFVNREYLSEDDYSSIIQDVKISYLDYLVQTHINLPQEIENLIVSPNNLSIRLLELKDKYPKIEMFEHLISDASVRVEGAKTIKLLNNDSDVYNENYYIGLMREMRDSNEELKTFYFDLVTLTLLQGSKRSASSLKHIIPFEDYSEIVSKIIDNANPDIQLDLFSKGMFERNEWTNNKIIPIYIPKFENALEFNAWVEEQNEKRVRNKLPIINPILPPSRINPETYQEEFFYAPMGDIFYEIPKLKVFKHQRQVMVLNSRFNRDQTKEEFLKIPRVIAVESPSGNREFYDIIKGNVINYQEYKINKEKGDTKLYEFIGYQKVRNSDGSFLTVLDSYGNKQYVYKQINLLGENRFLKEYYNHIRPSSVDNGSFKPIGGELLDSDIAEYFNNTAKLDKELKSKIEYSYIHMQPDNIEKIKKGTKTFTTRTDKEYMDNGTYRIGKDLMISVKNLGRAKVISPFGKGKPVIQFNVEGKTMQADEFAKKEGFNDWEDFKNNNYRSSNFVNGKSYRWVYDIKIVNLSKEELEKLNEYSINNATPQSVFDPTRERPNFDTLPSKSDTKTMTYAGVGSRQTPLKIKMIMQNLAKYLSNLGYTLNSGGAQGADIAFESGAGTKKQIFKKEDADDFTRDIAKEIHDNPDALTDGPVLDLLARNTFQIFGKNLDTPVDFVLAWTPLTLEGKVVTKAEDKVYYYKGHPNNTGGTGQAIALASLKGIPVINLADKNWKEQFDKVLLEIKTKEKNVNRKPLPEGLSILEINGTYDIMDYGVNGVSGEGIIAENIDTYNEAYEIAMNYKRPKPPVKKDKNDLVNIYDLQEKEKEEEEEFEQKEYTFSYKGKTIKTEFQLSPDQISALENLIDFMYNPDQHRYVLQGAAGTGKTAIIGYLQKYINESVLYIAPTHAATVELAFGTMKTGNKNFPSTVASSLNQDKKTKKWILSRKSANKLGMFGKTIVVDETSMLSNKDYIKLKDLSEQYKIIFVGDKKQIPEVIKLKKGDANIKNISIAFTENPSSNLDTIHRTSNNDIRHVLQKVRDSIKFQLYKIKENTDNLKFLNNWTTYRTLLKEYILKDPENTDYIAYTNHAVKLMNKSVREDLFNRFGEIQKGDILMGYLGYRSKQIDAGNLANSVSYTVQSVNKINKSDNSSYSGYKIYATSEKLLKLKSLGFNLPEVSETLYIPLSKSDNIPSDFTEEEYNSNNVELSKLFNTLYEHLEIAKKTNKWSNLESYKLTLASLLSKIDLSESYIYNHSTKKMELYNDSNLNDKNKAYNLYGANKESFIIEKGIDFGHAITVHKSQGRTTKNVFFDANTITKREDTILLENGVQISTEKQALLYVGLSRASDNLFVYTGWVPSIEIDNTILQEPKEPNPVINVPSKPDVYKIDKHIITITPDGTMIFKNGSTVKDITIQNKVKIAKHLRENILKVGTFNKIPYFVLNDGTVLGTGTTNYGKETVKDPVQLSKIRQTAKFYIKKC